ncbi:hypothetical protein DXX98_14080, partial [Janibacter melonis]|nr:hypothetical protein [Janibacter melonis]
MGIDTVLEYVLVAVGLLVLLGGLLVGLLRGRGGSDGDLPEQHRPPERPKGTTDHRSGTIVLDRPSDRATGAPKAPQRPTERDAPSGATAPAEPAESTEVTPAAPSAPAPQAPQSTTPAGPAGVVLCGACGAGAPGAAGVTSVDSAGSAGAVAPEGASRSVGRCGALGAPVALSLGRARTIVPLRRSVVPFGRS